MFCFYQRRCINKLPLLHGAEKVTSLIKISQQRQFLAGFLLFILLSIHEAKKVKQIPSSASKTRTRIIPRGKCEQSQQSC